MSLILDQLPTAEEFFKHYWNKKAFVVRDMIPKDVTEVLIDENHLAGLAMEEDVKSRLVRKGKNMADWRCDFGPFEEEVFSDLDEEDWSLLVQNVDQYHPDTAELLPLFNFCPRWLLDDIMVSFSPKGGTVGAHTDSYHVFLIQGKGSRQWKVANEVIKNEDCIEDIPLEILKEGFDGEEVTVKEGDVIYIPPKFGHEGVSLEPSLTYSVGFLGPSLSEMLNEFGHYLEEHHKNLPRYLGQNLTKDAAPFGIGNDQVVDFKKFMTAVFDEDYFTAWLTQYFSRPTQSEEAEIISDDLELPAETMLIKPPAIKIMMAPLKTPQKYIVAAGDYTFELDFEDLHVVNAMALEVPFPIGTFSNHTQILEELLERNVLQFT